MGMRILLEDDSMTTDQTQCGSQNRTVYVTYDLLCNPNPDEDGIQVLWIDADDEKCRMF